MTMSVTTSSVFPKSVSFHNTDSALYAQLCAMFDEARTDSGARWVTIGAGAHTLTFFAPRDAK